MLDLILDFEGTDTFSYTVSDDRGKLKKAKVSIIVKGSSDNKNPVETNQQIKTSQEQRAVQQEDKVQLKNQGDNNQGNDQTTQTIEKGDPTNQTDSTRR